MRLTHQKREIVVVSVGGSLIVPDSIDASFLTRFRETVLRHLKGGLSFYIITGGGKTARRYQDAVREARGELSREDIDWLGIHSTRLNGHLLRTLFRDEAYRKVIKDPNRASRGHHAVVIGAGWKPGNSSDYCAVLAAKKLGAKKLVNLSNIDYVYTADPKKDPHAQKIETIRWHEFRKLIPSEWDPGLSSPFDPVAAREAEALGIEVAVINGARLEELDNYLAGRPFIGTTIS